MKIRTFYRLEGGVYRVSIHTEEWSENDVKLMEKFGEPDINIGGDLEYSAPNAEPVTWHIDESYRRIKSEPISMAFDSRDTPVAKELANLWAQNMVTAISNAFASLHAHTDDFTREVVNTLSVYS